MAEIKILVQVGVGASAQQTEIAASQETTVKQLKEMIADRRGREIGQRIVINQLNLIWNGRKLGEQQDGQYLSNVGMADGSRLICIISSAKPTAQQTTEEKANSNFAMRSEPQSAPSEQKIVLKCNFDKRPFGFAVWANAQGKNAIVTKVAGERALRLGIQIGYVVFTCNGEKVYGKPHDEVLELLKTTKCPLVLEFADLGKEYQCVFQRKPLGFTVIQDREENNAKVSKINTRDAQEKNIKIGSYLVGVQSGAPISNNGVEVLIPTNVFGKKHRAIIATINQAAFPITVKYRHPPPLLMLSPSRRQRRR